MMMLCLLFSYLLVLLQQVVVSGAMESPQSNRVYDMDVADRLNDFSFQLYNEIVRTSNGNVLFSPVSIFTAFTMIGIGARGRTRNEMTLAFKWDHLDKLVNDMKPLYDALSRRNSTGSRLEIANKVWIANDMKVMKQYKRKLAYYFHAEIGREVFTSNPNLARANINEWIEQRTSKNIKNFFPANSFNTFTRVVLANAMFFKGKWQQPFDKGDTRTGRFYLAGGKHVRVPYMTREDTFPAYFDEEQSVQLLEMPYTHGQYSMIFVIPVMASIQHVESNINSRMLGKWIRTLTARHTNWSSKSVFIPKFKIEHSFPLNKLLEGLNVRDLITPGMADLSGINGKKDLFLSTALHRSRIEVDEDGTKSSSATGLGIQMLSYPMTIRLERPFLFYIIHRPSKTIIFSGKVMNPIERTRDISVEDILAVHPHDPSVNMKLTLNNSALRFVIPVLLFFSPLFSITLSLYAC